MLIFTDYYNVRHFISKGQKMKKLLCLISCALCVISCAKNQQKYYQEQQAQYIQQYVQSPEQETTGTNQAYAADWNSTIRYDTDMQNMYATSPTKFDKPLDMYMVMALALKYNYTARMVRYQENLMKAGQGGFSALPEIVSNAGYINTNYSDTSPDLKVAWNLLDLSTTYVMNTDPALQPGIAAEESRKVTQNILQEARVLYWKALTAQRLLPVLDDTIEHITLDVDEMNAKAKELAVNGQNPPTEELVRKRKYMEAVKKLSALKRDLETAHERLASLMGLHPQTQFSLAGKEYGNFALPEIKSDLAKLEWLALTNRPEMRVHDLMTTNDNLHFIIANFRDNQGINYASDPNAYNKEWCNQAKEVTMSVYENNPNNGLTLEELRRQRMTSLILNQVYIGWARYMSSMEDFQIAMEIAGTSENIAEDITSANGSHAEKSLLEAARALSDETKASMAYVDLEDSLGALYATIGMDAVSPEIINAEPAQIALALRNIMEQWREGDWTVDGTHDMDIPQHRPPVEVTLDNAVLPNAKYSVGERINIRVPAEVFTQMGWSEDTQIQTKATLQDNMPLPQWLKYSNASLAFSGLAMPGDGGVYPIKVYAMDPENNIAFITFTLTITESYVPSMNVRGLDRKRSATVMKKCHGNQCTDQVLDDVQVLMPPAPSY